ncbi:MAG: NADH-quinone oxidoreductase subunit NuoE [Proteobacteria bacterium]|nr:NADH-quinone oxidoreductase subunit NuoE [Pseudomonadota bacterium]
MTQCNCNKVKVVKEITAEDFAKIDEVIERYRGKPGSLIPVLRQAQEICGYLPDQVQRRIAQGLGLPPSQVYGVVTFYSFFTMVPRGRHTVRVCLGTACYVKGTRKNLGKIQQELGVEVGDTTEDLKYTLETVRCLGACGLAPAIVIDSDTHGLVGSGKVMDILKAYD